MSGITDVSRRGLLGGAAGLGTAALLAGCGSNRGRGSKDPVGGEGGKASLEQWYHQYGEDGTKNAALGYAKEYTEADVTVTWVPATSGYGAKLSSAFSGGSAPDCFEFHTDRSMVAAEQVAPLDDLVAEVIDDFAESDIKSNTIDGKQYAIPMIIDPQMIYYRKSMLDAKGITPPETLDDLVAAAKELTDGKVKGLFLGNDANATGGAILNTLVFAAGADFLDDDHKVSINFDGLGAALETMRRFTADKSLLLGAPTDWVDPGAINSELCAMQWIGMWAVPGMEKAHPDDIGCFPAPKVGSQGRPAVWKGGWSAMVNAKGPNVDAAKAFTKWLWIDNTAAQEDWCLSYGFHIPPRTSVAEKAAKLTEGVAAESVKFNTEAGFAQSPEWTPAMDTALKDAATRIVGKGADPSTELKSAEKKINNELDKIFG